MFHLYLEAVPDSVPSVCQFEGLFSGVAKPPKEEFSPVLFHRVAELLQEAGKRFAEADKVPHASLLSKKRALATSSDPLLGKTTPFNPFLPRLVGNLSGSRSAGFMVLEAGKLEVLSRQLLESQSVSFWVFNALLNWLKQESFVPSDLILFDELVQAFSLAMVGSSSSLASLAAFFQAKRRGCVLSHFPAHIGVHFHSLLAASSFDGPNLFEEEVLSRVLAESREDSAVSANLALVKAVSFPVFGAAKSGWKASSDQSSSAASSAAASRGRGRDSSSDQNKKGYPSSPALSGCQSRKRKACSPAPRFAKSSRCSAKASKGNGFRK